MPPQVIHREELLRLLREEAVQLLEGPRHEYEEEHLPGAISIPLRRLDRQTSLALDRDRPIVVYCYDDQ